MVFRRMVSELNGSSRANLLNPDIEIAVAGTVRGIGDEAAIAGNHRVASDTRIEGELL